MKLIIQSQARDWLRTRSPNGHTQGERDAYYGAYLDALNWHVDVAKLPEAERIAVLTAAFEEAEHYMQTLEFGPSGPVRAWYSPIKWINQMLDWTIALLP